MSRPTAFVFIAVFVLIILVPSATRAMKTEASWQPDPALLSRLAPETLIHGYALRPPLGYTRNSVDNGFAHTETWEGVSQDAGSTPEMVIVVIPPILGIAVTQPDRAIGCYLHEVRRKVNAVVTEPLQEGRVAGRLFWRVAWRGAAESQGGPVAVRGFVYATREQGSVILVGAHDAFSSADKTLLLAEASALTVHRCE